jgi:chromate transport protein ChrA
MPPTNAGTEKVPQVIWLTTSLMALLALLSLVDAIQGLRVLITRPANADPAIAGTYTGLSALAMAALGFAAFMILRRMARSRRVALWVVIAYPVVFFAVFFGFNPIGVLLVVIILVLLFRPAVREWTDPPAAAPAVTRRPKR